MSRAVSWITPKVEVIEQHGDLILQNTVSLDASPQNIGVWLRQNAERWPDKPFILQRDADGTWQGPTYAQALRRANRLSSGLLAQGLDGSRPVAILSENSVDMALLQLATIAGWHPGRADQLCLFRALADRRAHQAYPGRHQRAAAPDVRRQRPHA
jgi:non-ribosomal peptide synthetase component F